MLVVALTMLVGCSQALTEEQLTSARQLWADGGVSSYEYTIELSDMAGDRTYRITVENEQVSAIQPEPSESDRLNGVDLFSVPALLSAAERWWIEEKHVEIKFDKELGYITQVNQDDPSVEDDEFELNITDFVARP